MHCMLGVRLDEDLESTLPIRTRMLLRHSQLDILQTTMH